LGLYGRYRSSSRAWCRPRRSPRAGVAQLALLVDAGEDRRAALFQLAQVAQPGFEIAQLGVVQPAGDFLAVAGDERHRRAFVEQRDGGADLRRCGADLGGDGLGDLARERRGNVCHCV
jgi:hypothetical protein